MKHSISYFSLNINGFYEKVSSLIKIFKILNTAYVIAHIFVHITLYIMTIVNMDEVYE